MSLVLLHRPPRRPTVFPYTTLFRSPPSRREVIVVVRLRDAVRLTVTHGVPPLSSCRYELRVDAWWRCRDRKSTRLNSSHLGISYAVFCLKEEKHGDASPSVTVHSLP